MNTNRLVIGILAHVDAGKTTLAESILYHSGSIKKLGRVDHKDAFLDTYALERERGITIFSKQAELMLKEKEVTLLDTPGHIDFSAEMERTLSVLDYAILVVSGSDGVQGHTQTLWKLLKHYQIPVFIFVNKMDQLSNDKEKLLEELKKKLDINCVYFGENQGNEEFFENVAMCDESLMEGYLENLKIENDSICDCIQERKIFPCYFGSALKTQGIEEFLDGIEKYSKCQNYGEEFGAKVYKIGRDINDNRITYIKITGGSLKVKDSLSNNSDDEDKLWKEKVDQIRIYSGEQYSAVNEAKAGTICAVTGLSKTYAGEGLGIEKELEVPVLEPVLTYQIKLPEDCNVHLMYSKLCLLEEEEPQLHIVWDEINNEIRAQVMGEVQIEILKRMILERFDVNVDFGKGSIVYKETIEDIVEGVGHFEPLRHYAEVHLIMEPAKRGSGLEFKSICSEDMLDKSWQRLILTHLEEKKHKGVLTGAYVTDIKVTLVSGRAHQKHTEGGDFRQATYRAIRQGLKNAKSVLLEPIYEFKLEVPSQMVGRALSDIQRMHGDFEPPIVEGDMAVVIGTAPVLTMQDYQTEVLSYTKGCGKLFCSLKGYERCHNEEEIIVEKNYDSEQDLENPTSSVFCAHGAGFVVPWNEVYSYMHIEAYKQKNAKQTEDLEIKSINSAKIQSVSLGVNDKELEEIFTRTYGAIKQKRSSWSKNLGDAEYSSKRVVHSQKSLKQKENYLLVDGYNIIFAWEELNELSKVNFGAAREKLADILCNYQGFKDVKLILVFDAYKVEGSKGEVSKYNNIYIVYTKEAETADAYIEKVTHDIGRKHNVTVATSDALEQLIVWGQGANRMSANDLRIEIESTSVEIRESLQEIKKDKNRLFDNLTEDVADLMEDVRLGKKKL